MGFDIDLGLGGAAQAAAEIYSTNEQNRVTREENEKARNYNTWRENVAHERQDYYDRTAWNRSEISASRARDFSKSEAQVARDFTERMSSTAFQRGVKDMKAAGINPLLAYSKGGASTPNAAGAATSSGSAKGGSSKVGSTSMTAKMAKMQLQQLVSNALQIKKLDKEIDILGEKEKQEKESAKQKRMVTDERKSRTDAIQDLGNFISEKVTSTTKGLQKQEKWNPFKRLNMINLDHRNIRDKRVSRGAKKYLKKIKRRKK